MRVTNSMMVRNFLNNLYTNSKRLDSLQRQMSSNKKINRFSDDPIGQFRSLEIRAKIDKIGQYTRNINDAKSWLLQTETSVMELNEVVKTVYDNVLDVSNDTKSELERSIVANNLKELKEQIFQILNATYGDKYIFGGYNTTKKPLVQSGSDILYNGINLIDATAEEIDNIRSQKLNYEVAKASYINVSVNAADVLGTGQDNLFKMLDELIEGLNNGEPVSYFSSFNEKIKSSQDNILNVITEVGGRVNRLEFLEERYAIDELNYLSIKSSIEDIDMAEVITSLEMAKSVYNAALAVGASIIQPSLVNFLW